MEVHHFKPPGFCHLVTAVYPSIMNDGTKMDDDDPLGKCLIENRFKPMRWRISWSENGELLGACQLLILTNPKCLNHIWTWMIKPSCDRVKWTNLVPEILFNARWKRRSLKGQCIQEAKLSKQGPKCWEEKEELIVFWSLFFISSHYLSNFLEHWGPGL